MSELFENDPYPQRIVCLTEETTETLYLLEQDWRIVVISGPAARSDGLKGLHGIIQRWVRSTPG